MTFDISRPDALAIGAAAEPRRHCLDPSWREALAWRDAATAMSHIAIAEALEGKSVDWMEKVGDEQYGK